VLAFGVLLASGISVLLLEMEIFAFRKEFVAFGIERLVYWVKILVFETFAFETKVIVLGGEEFVSGMKADVVGMVLLVFGTQVVEFEMVSVVGMEVIVLEMIEFEMVLAIGMVVIVLELEVVGF
jgi:hypothetical protein